MDYAAFKSLIKSYFFDFKFFFIFLGIINCIKPGIVIGNIISLIGGYLLASRGFYNINFFKIIIGMVFIISSACIINNIFDWDIDIHMSRTKNRILCIYHKNKYLIFFLWFFSIILYIFGCIILYIYTNFLCFFLSSVGFYTYIFLYSLILKRISVFSTILGGFSGSLLPIIGYVAVKNNLDYFCIIIFFMFIFWQIIHVYSLSIFRLEDYKNIKIPLFPVIYGIKKTKNIINFCIFCFMLCNFFLYIFCYVNDMYCFYTIIIIFIWYFFSIFGNYYFNVLIWSRIMFFLSILVISLVSFLMSIYYY